MIATTGDALRVWEVERGGGRDADGDVDEEDDGFDEMGQQQGMYSASRQVGKIGWGRHEPGVRLRERSKLTNVSVQSPRPVLHIV